jgi:hypothetical protein
MPRQNNEQRSISDRISTSIAILRQLNELTELLRAIRRDIRSAKDRGIRWNAETLAASESYATNNGTNDVAWIDVNDAAHLFGMKHQSIKNSISRESFPVPTYKLGKRRVIDRKVLASYFAERSSEGMAKLVPRIGRKTR